MQRKAITKFGPATKNWQIWTCSTSSKPITRMWQPEKDFLHSSISPNTWAASTWFSGFHRSTLGGWATGTRESVGILPPNMSTRSSEKHQLRELWKDHAQKILPTISKCLSGNRWSKRMYLRRWFSNKVMSSKVSKWKPCNAEVEAGDDTHGSSTSTCLAMVSSDNEGKVKNKYIYLYIYIYKRWRTRTWPCKWGPTLESIAHCSCSRRSARSELCFRTRWRCWG